MKKLVALVLALLMLCSYAVAEDLGVQVIGGDNAAMEVVSLDDLQIGQSYKIDGYATVKVQDFNFVDSFAQYTKGKAGDNALGDRWVLDADCTIRDVYGDSRGEQISQYVMMTPFKMDGNWEYINVAKNIYWKESEVSADFAWLWLDLVNLQHTEVDFNKEASVTVVFDDEYQFAGWIRQTDPNYVQRVYRWNYEGRYAINPFVDPSDEYPIKMMYTGSFVFGCTLPMEVVNSTAPLRMEIKLGENELTYHIRK